MKYFGFLAVAFLTLGYVVLQLASPAGARLVSEAPFGLVVDVFGFLAFVVGWSVVWFLFSAHRWKEVGFYTSLALLVEGAILLISRPAQIFFGAHPLVYLFTDAIFLGTLTVSLFVLSMLLDPVWERLNPKTRAKTSG